MPAEGLIVSSKNGKRFGAWVMPDNASPGAIENLLKTTVRASDRPLLTHSENSTQIAKGQHQAPFRDCHLEKANILSWLAWQDPPAQTPQLALAKGLLDAKADSLNSFVQWFKDLYVL